MALVLAILGACASCSHEGVIDVSPGPGRVWANHCLIHRSCDDVEPLPRCPRDTKTSPLPIPTTLPVGSVVTYSIAGRMHFDGGEVALVARWSEDEGRGCCPAWKKAVLVGEDGSKFELPHFGCFGDESRLCCNVVASSQMVVATGAMQLGVEVAFEQENGGGNRGERDERSWFFRSEVKLCALQK